MQPGDLPYREPRPPGRDARDLDRHLQVAQVLDDVLLTSRGMMVYRSSRCLEQLCVEGRPQIP